MSASGITILCIDDDPSAVMIRRLVLVSAGYEVVTATDGNEALRLFNERNVDLVISDHFLRGTTGGEIAAKMKAIKPGIPIVIISGFPERPDGTEHADVFIEKGGPPPAMLAVVAELLSRKAKAKGM
jgi:CheY-like chemotaxis protein